MASTKFVDNLHPWVSTKPAAGQIVAIKQSLVMGEASGTLLSPSA